MLCKVALLHVMMKCVFVESHVTLPSKELSLTEHQMRKAMGKACMNCNLRHDLMNFNGNCPKQTLIQLWLARCRIYESFHKTL